MCNAEYHKAQMVLFTQASHQGLISQIFPFSQTCNVRGGGQSMSALRLLRDQE